MSEVGCNGYLYVDGTGTDATPVWAEAKRAKDVTTPLEKGEVDVSRRESKWKLFKGALKETGVEFGYQYKRGSDAIWDELIDSFLNGTPIHVAVMDDEITNSGARGIDFWGEVFGIPRDEPLEDGMMLNITIKPTDFEEPAGTLIEPDLVTIA